jgi:microcin C transport system substrate-binding protein
VRQAFNLAFNFEEANDKLFYGGYIRVGSYFDNSELKAAGLPEGRELEILNEVRDQVPPEVFTTEFKNPVNKEPAEFRSHMLEATKLLDAAGWKVREEVVEDASCGLTCKAMRLVGISSATTVNVRRNDKGELLTAEILIFEPAFERIVLPFVADLKKLGVSASARLIDPSQYEQRERSHDYDIIIDTFQQSNSPGNEQRDFWGSMTADRDGTRNTVGIKSPAVDKLIDRIVFAKDREELVAATHALDRVLLWNHYVVPQWHYPFERVASWDKFGRPEKLPSQDPSYLPAWWIDEAKVRALAAARGK